MPDARMWSDMKSSSNLTFSPGFKRLLLIIAAINGLVGIKRIIESFGSPQIYKKDFIQEYLMAKAMLTGVNPYLPLPELANRFMSAANYNEIQHPTPHPPGVGLLSLPFGLLNYETAVVIWLFFELACLAASVLLLLRWWGKPVKAGAAIVLFGFALGWAPIAQDLWYGQLNLCLLTLLLSAWLALRAEKNALGGAMLGGLIALKLMAWPIVIFLALSRKWRSVVAASAVVVTVHLIAMVVSGFDCVKDYYLTIAPHVASIYRVHDSNFSAWTWGARLFAGSGANFLAPPLWSSTLLAQLFTYLAPLAILSFALAFALRARRFDTSFGLLVCAGILVSPIAWSHYLALASVPMAITANRLWTMGFPRKLALPAGVFFMLLSVPPLAFAYAAILFTDLKTPEGISAAPFMAGMFTLIPAVALLGLTWLVWRLDRAPHDEVIVGGELDKLPEKGYAQAI